MSDQMILTLENDKLGEKAILLTVNAYQKEVKPCLKAEPLCQRILKKH
jgi:hypothetical protein